MRLPVSARLECCAGLVPQGARAADIGADHGYLGISLLLNGRAEFVHASELREQPLRRAMENALRFGVADRMRFSRADGLDAIDPDEVDTIVCAGMGGDLIAQILDRCRWVRDPRYTLILQPQSSGNDLRRKLARMGFAIEQEHLVRVGETDEQPLAEFLQTVKQALGCPGLRYVDGGKPVRRVAVGGGSCADGMLEAVAAGCDTFVTADVRYNQFWDAHDLGLNLIDAGHFYTENPVTRVLADTLKRAFPDISVKISETHTDCMKYA